MKTNAQLFMDYINSPEVLTNELCNKPVLPKVKRKNRLFQAFKEVKEEQKLNHQKASRQ